MYCGLGGAEEPPYDEGDVCAGEGDDPLGEAEPEAEADAVTAGADEPALNPGIGTATTPLATCAEAAPMRERPSKNAEYMLMDIKLKHVTCVFASEREVREL